MKDTEKLNKALEKALSERYEVSIKETMQKCNIKHIQSNDLMVMCTNLLRKHPEYRLVKFVSDLHGNSATQSLQECGVLTCLEYDDGNEFTKGELENA